MTTDGGSGGEVTRAGLLEASVADSRHRLCWLALAFSLSLVLGLGSIGLWGARERRFGACVADMVREGHWLVPNLWGRLRLEKPPLPYWICSTGALVTGHLNEWTLRVPSLLAAALVVAAVYSIGSQAGGSQLGPLAVLLLLSSFYFASELRQPSNDLFLTGFSAAALACWWRGYQLTGSRGRWWAAAGVCAGLAIASKGPVALAVLAPPILGILAWQRQRALPRTPAALAGILLALAVGLAWPGAVMVFEPEAWRIWFWDAVTSAVQGSYFTWLDRGLWYYFTQWPTYLFPWSVVSLLAVRYGFQGRAAAVPLAVRFAWFWFFGNMLVFTLFATRKNYYLMPMR